MINAQVIVTGVGYKVAEACQDSISDVFSDKLVKPNIGASVVKELLESDLDVLMVSRTESKLKQIYNSIKNKSPHAKLKYIAVDLLDNELVKSILNCIEDTKSVHLVHCAGLSAGSYKIPDDNPYLCIEDTPLDLPIVEFESVVKSLLILVKVLMPRFSCQEETRIVVVSSMSGVRAVPLGYSHAGAKGGLHQAVRSLTLELNKKNIYVSEIMPGMVNTGLYDPILFRIR